MQRKPKEINFSQEADAQVAAIKSRIGQEVPLSNRYVRGQRAILVSVDGDTATLRFPNGATLTQVPLRDLVDDSGYWKTSKPRAKMRCTSIHEVRDTRKISGARA